MGIGLCLLSALTLALSMNLQFFALAGDGNNCLIKTFHRNCLWSLGLMLYAVANLMYVAALSFAPLSLLSALFANVLVFNAIFANRIMGVALTRTDIIGLVIIVLSVGCCGALG